MKGTKGGWDLLIVPRGTFGGGWRILFVETDPSVRSARGVAWGVFPRMTLMAADGGRGRSISACRDGVLC